LRRLIPNALELAAANAHDRRPDFIMKLRITFHLQLATRPSAVSPTTGEGWKLMHRQARRSFDRGDAILHRLLHLLERAYVDLAHAHARDAELVGEVRERDRVLGEPRRAYLSRSAAGGVGCSTETGSDAGKVFSRASSSAFSWRLRLSSPSS
jgi:hypothetical protein